MTQEMGTEILRSKTDDKSLSWGFRKSN